MKKEATALKQLAMLKKNFIKLTNAVDWEDAVSQFPLFACEVELKKFIALKFTHRCIYVHILHSFLNMHVHLVLIFLIKAYYSILVFTSIPKESESMCHM